MRGGMDMDAMVDRTVKTMACTSRKMMAAARTLRGDDTPCDCPLAGDRELGGLARRCRASVEAASQACRRGDREGLPALLEDFRRSSGAVLRAIWD